MNYGMYISASGALTSLYRQDVITNNLANLNTVGFKPDMVAAMQRDAVRIEDGVTHLPSNEMLEKLGAGVLMADNRVSFRQGSPQTTGNDFDVMVEGKGFFMISDVAQDGAEQLRLTRDGRFLRDDRGMLVDLDGRPVLDAGARPITIPEGGRISIAADGMITQNGATIAQLGLFDAPDPKALTKIGHSTFGLLGNAAENLLPGTGRMIQGALESSATDEIKSLMDVQSASRAVSGNIRMMTYHDQMMQRTINTFARLG